jgi:hypothetical protein
VDTKALLVLGMNLFKTVNLCFKHENDMFNKLPPNLGALKQITLIGSQFL